MNTAQKQSTSIDANRDDVIRIMGRIEKHLEREQMLLHGTGEDPGLIAVSQLMEKRLEILESEMRREQRASTFVFSIVIAAFLIQTVISFLIAFLE